MLGSAFATLPAKNLEESKKFFKDVLDLEVIDENAGGITFQTGSSKIFVYESEYAGTNQATALSWDVDSVRDTVDTLKKRGVNFERYDMPGVSHEGDVHIMESLHAAWFKDPAGNILALTSEVG